jgi:PTS system mannose-specific IIA component
VIGTVIVSHGGLACELLRCARRIVGELPNFEEVCLDWEEGLESARQRIGAAISQVDQGDGVVVLADAYGSTACNAALAHLDPGRVEILAGVNLPMVLRLGCVPAKGMSFDEAMEWLRDKGKASICRAIEMAPPAVLAPCMEEVAKQAEESR